MRSVVLALSILVGGLWGCTITGDVQVQSSSCENVPRSVCDAQVRAAANAAGGAVKDVVVKCTIQACTRANGSGTATVIRPDGTQVTRAWSYVGDPGQLPDPVCVKIPEDLCQREVASMINEASVNKHLVGITVTCLDQCDATSGNIRIDYVFEDGSTETTPSGW